MSTSCPVHGAKFIGRGAAGGDSYQCGECLKITATRGHKKKMSLREFQDIFKPGGYVMHGDKLDPEDFERTLKIISHDEVRAASLAADARRPRGTDKVRFGVAIRAAAREPMLNADRDSIRLGLDYRKLEDYAKSKAPAVTGDPAYIVVKPTCGQTAKYGRNSTFWGERLWKVYRLKYASGFVARTDVGHTTKHFPTMGELLSAIEQSGWTRIR
jgi:hypothetical protein